MAPAHWRPGGAALSTGIHIAMAPVECGSHATLRGEGAVRLSARGGGEEGGEQGPGGLRWRTDWVVERIRPAKRINSLPKVAPKVTSGTVSILTGYKR